MACQRSVPVRLDVGRPAGGIHGPGGVPARAAWRRSARCLDIPADGTSTRRRATPHPETRWTVLALACPGGSVDGIGRRQPSHRATRLPIDRYNNDGRGAFTSSQRWVQGFTVRWAAELDARCFQRGFCLASRRTSSRISSRTGGRPVVFGNAALAVARPSPTRSRPARARLNADNGTPRENWADPCLPNTISLPGFLAAYNSYLHILSAEDHRRRVQPLTVVPGTPFQGRERDILKLHATILSNDQLFLVQAVDRFRCRVIVKSPFGRPSRPH